MNNWYNIWSNRVYRDNTSTLETLLNLDGFDSGFGSLTQKDWLQYINDIKSVLKIEQSSSIYEIGCGSGAFLYPFYIDGYLIGGIDYSQVLIKIAKQYMPNAELCIKEAIDLDTGVKYDFIISNSVFHYFETKEYARSVIDRMLIKANKSIAILDLNDISKKKEADLLRRGTLSEKEYIKKYANLSQQFYSKEWFKDIAFFYGYKIKIWDQKIDNYMNSSYRFNVVFEK